MDISMNFQRKLNRGEWVKARRSRSSASLRSATPGCSRQHLIYITYTIYSFYFPVNLSITQ